MKEKEYILVSIYGKDKPGITASITKILAEHSVDLINIDQAAVHGRLTLYLLIGIEKHNLNSETVLKELLFKAKQLGLDLDFAAFDSDKVFDNQKYKYFAITCLGENVNSGAVAAISEILASKNLNIENIKKLAHKNLNCFEIIAKTEQFDIKSKELTKSLMPLNAQYNIDIAVQKETIYRKSKRLVVMDMDSTLIQVEVIDELAKLLNVGEKVSQITEKAMNGEIDFTESLRQRVALLKGLPEEKLTEVYNNIPFTKGAKRLIKVLKKLGYKTAVLSGGFDFFTSRLKEELGLDYAYSNRLEIKDGKLTGNVIGEIVTGKRKAELLISIAEELGISLDQTIAIGDGANDLKMISKAGLGIAFNAKPKVREEAGTFVSSNGLDSILYLLGISEHDMEL
ncbi:MAG: phosphoserine phosphatase SerB [Nitrospinae bacterium]|nr:phosphoserine phosphatase SerB [Nitrospinota bacterium]